MRNDMQNWETMVTLGKKNPGLATRRLSGESRKIRNAPDDYNIAEHRLFVKGVFSAFLVCLGSQPN